MNTKELVRISLMGCVQFLLFYMFSDILYVEVITIITIIFALIFSKKEAIFASIIFGLLNIILKQGITTWSIMYFIIYPMYSLIIGIFKSKLLNSKIMIVVVCFIFSFMTGQLLQLPYMLISKNITIYYIIIGFKTSIIQATITSCICYFIINVLKKIKGR